MPRRVTPESSPGTLVAASEWQGKDRKRPSTRSLKKTNTQHELMEKNASLQANMRRLGLAEHERPSSLTRSLTSVLMPPPKPKLDEHDVRVNARHNRAQDMQHTGFVIDPRSSKFMPRWDMAMVVALCFTAIVTPVEVAFFETDQYVTPIFVINRVVDTIFTLDIFLTFNVAYQTGAGAGAYWVFNKRTIAGNYVRGWLFFDVISVLPYWSITMRWRDPFGTNPAESTNEVSLARTAVLFRIVKLLRMLKLARVFKASRVLQRSILDFVMNEWEWTFAVLKMLKLFTFLTLYAHWQACVWGLISSYMHDDGHPTWIGAFNETFVDQYGPEPPGGFDVYIAALYWSVMTLTSIGYGEMTPVNSAERLLCSIYMMLSGVMWTWAIGSVAAIASTLDPNSVEHHNTLDALNYFMRERELPRRLRMTLREFFNNARRIHELNNDGHLLNKMSPLLQGVVAITANRKWLQHVWYFRDIESVENGSEFIVALAKQLVIRSFVAHERLPTGQLYILRSGCVVRMWRFLVVGTVFGEDMILEKKSLVDYAQAVALSYVEAYTLRRPDLEEVLHDFPEAAKRVRGAAWRITLQRALLLYMARRQGKSGPRSVALRHQANGYAEVHDSYNIEQRVTQLHNALVRNPQGKNSLVLAPAAALMAAGSSRAGPLASPAAESSLAPLSPTPGHEPPSSTSSSPDARMQATRTDVLTSRVDDLSKKMEQLLKMQSSMAETMRELKAEVISRRT